VRQITLYQKILVGVDGTEQSLKALATGVDIAKQFGAELHVFHAVKHHYRFSTIPFSPVLGVQASMMFNTLNDEWQIHEAEETGRQVIKQAEQSVRDIDPEFAENVTYHLETRMAAQRFVEQFVKQNSIDLVIIQNLVHHPGDKQSTDSTTKRIVNVSPCQVLVVR